VSNSPVDLIGMGRTMAQHDVRLGEVERRLLALEEKIDRLQWWVVTTAGGVAVAVAMLALEFLLRR
jgi:hypothetical protein